MPTAGGQSTQEKERQSRLHQNRFAQTLGQARQGFYGVPKKLKELQRNIFLATALGAESQKNFPTPKNSQAKKKKPSGPPKPQPYSTRSKKISSELGITPENRKSNQKAYGTNQKRAPTLSGLLAQRYVRGQLSQAEKEKAAGTPTPQPYSSRFRNAASRAMGSKFGIEPENQNVNDRKNDLLQNQAQARRNFPTLPISPPIPLYPEEGDKEEEEGEGDEGGEENEQNEQEQQSGSDPSVLQAQQLAQNQQMARQRQQRQAAAATPQKGAAGGQMNDASKQVRKAAEKAIRRGVEELAQLIGNAFDAGTLGVSTLVTIFMYAVNLTDFSMQMFTYYVKNNLLSFLFPPLDGWDPIPLSTKIVPVVVLHAIVILCDILVLGFVVIAFVLMIIIVFGPSIGLAGLVYAMFNGMSITTLINSLASVFSSVK